MPLSAIRNYMEYLPRRMAETRMMQGEAASVPYMDEERHEMWNRQMREHFPESAKPATPNRLSSIGVKVIRVPK
jgi:hypothetical protein